MLEKTIETTFTNLVKSGGGICLKLTGYRGIPDRLVLVPGGRAFFVELKAPGKVSRPEQEEAQRRLRSQGFNVYEASDVYSIASIIEEEFCI